MGFDFVAELMEKPCLFEELNHYRTYAKREDMHYTRQFLQTFTTKYGDCNCVLR
jgi:hypothetical protein